MKKLICVLSILSLSAFSAVIEKEYEMVESKIKVSEKTSVLLDTMTVGDEPYIYQSGDETYTNYEYLFSLTLPKSKTLVDVRYELRTINERTSEEFNIVTKCGKISLEASKSYGETLKEDKDTVTLKFPLYVTYKGKTSKGNIGCTKEAIKALSFNLRTKLELDVMGYSESSKGEMADEEGPYGGTVNTSTGVAN